MYCDIPTMSGMVTTFVATPLNRSGILVLPCFGEWDESIAGRVESL